TLEYTLRKTIEGMAERLRDNPTDVNDLSALRAAIELTEELPFKVTLWSVQNVAYDLLQDIYPGVFDKKDTDEDAREWVGHFEVLAHKLSLRMD
ncbi:MAG TPA: hypothetical protein VER03_17600, partial [Bryobacteraceae bacterium]|nr:hypothetical protein [Bryobacteraceae bacterium]